MASGKCLIAIKTERHAGTKAAVLEHIHTKVAAWVARTRPLIEDATRGDPSPDRRVPRCSHAPERRHLGAPGTRAPEPRGAEALKFYPGDIDGDIARV